MFLFGWGLSMAWGVIGDRIGRVRALALTILTYSLFTLLCGLVTNIWQLMFLRVLCGVGLGGEQPVGSTFVAEALPEDRRVKAAGLLHTGYYAGLPARLDCQLLHRRELRLALDVRVRRPSGDLRRLDHVEREGVAQVRGDEEDGPAVDEGIVRRALHAAVTRSARS